MDDDDDVASRGAYRRRMGSAMVAVGRWGSGRLWQPSWTLRGGSQQNEAIMMTRDRGLKYHDLNASTLSHFLFPRGHGRCEPRLFVQRIS